MGVDGGISGCSGQVLILSIRDVKVGLWIAILLRQAKINNIDLIASLSNTHQEVVWLDIPVDKRLGVDILDTGYLSNE